MAELPPRAMAGATWRSSCYGCRSGPVNGLQRPRLVKNFVFLVRVLLHCADAQVLGLSGLFLFGSSTFFTVSDILFASYAASVSGALEEV